MPENEQVSIGKDGEIRIPDAILRRFGLTEGLTVDIKEVDDGLLPRPSLWASIEIYTPERKAEFLLSNSIDEADYQDAVAEVRKMGLDPDMIPHYRPEPH